MAMSDSVFYCSASERGQLTLPPFLCEKPGTVSPTHFSQAPVQVYGVRLPKTYAIGSTIATASSGTGSGPVPENR